MTCALEVLRALDSAQVAEVLDLVDDVARHDGNSPLAEHVMLHLRHGGDADVRHVLARDGAGHLVGYAHLDVTDLVEGPSGELAVRPEARRQDVGRSIVEELIAQCAEVPGQSGRLRLWAHGESAPAARLAASLGFTRSRVLWQMRRSLYAALAPVRLPDGITLRAFQPGVDDVAWLELNARAFAHLPDQGSWTEEDLRRRMDEPWFDPAGFLLAETKDGDLAGFHWTKVHDHAHGAPGHPGDLAGDHPPDHNADHNADHPHEPPHPAIGPHQAMGEVYVVGVDPAWQGTGLGRALVLAGLRHLRGSPDGLAQVMLYVDADNVRAIRLYEALGFTRWDTDVLYRQAPTDAEPPGGP